MKSYPYVQINSIDDLPAPEEGTGLVGHYAFQYIDFNEAAEYAMNNIFVDCCFFGCDLIPAQYRLLRDCLVLPRMQQVFPAFTPELYTKDTLYEGFDSRDPESFSRSYDARVYSDYKASGVVSEDIRVTLSRSLHDHSIFDAMKDFLMRHGVRKIVGVMGGHGVARSDEGYRKIVFLSKKLTEKGMMMLSGGGPGAMEATHVGAWMAGRTKAETEEALDILVSAGEADPAEWLRSSYEVMTRYPQKKYVSLSIPTWYYGHEPSTPFATHIAKFFMNSVREDMILSIAVGGIIFTPGSAGTMQEIFQVAQKLHYDTYGRTSPMIFLGKKFYTEEIPVYPFLEDLSRRGIYKNLVLSITDDPEDIVKQLL